MGKTYVYVEQEDGSCVERGSVSRKYTYAVCVRGVPVGRAKVLLKRDIETLRDRNVQSGDEIRALVTETPVEGQTIEWGNDNQDGYTSYLLGDRTVNVGKRETLDSVIAKTTFYISKAISQRVEEIKRIEAVLARLDEEPDVDARITTGLAREVEGGVLRFLAPAVLGFSQSRDNAEKRANTEHNQRYYDERQVVVTRTHEGKATCSLKGFTQ